MKANYFKNIDWNKLKPKSGLGWLGLGILLAFAAYGLIIVLKFILILAIVAVIGICVYELIKLTRKGKETK